MFTLQDTKQLHKLMKENSHNDHLIKKLLNSYQFTLRKINHEMRNPLTMISSTLQLIENQHPEVTGYTHWSSVLEDIDFMEKLLEDLTSYYNDIPLQKRLIHTSAFFNQTVLSFVSAFTDSPMEFTSKIDQNLPDLWGDATKLRQLFLNLLRNALEATSYKGKIHLSAIRESNLLVVKITDNGCGITKSHLSDIFIPFTTYKDNGTGLGLAIAKSIVELHHGSISVDSLPNQGSTFTVTLPMENGCS